MSATGCVVDDSPKHFTKGKSLYVIYIREKNLTIKFYMRGMMLYVSIRLPPEKKMESCKKVQITG